MRAAIYSPYLDTLGGGERYIFSVALALFENGWSVDIESKNPKILIQGESRFGIDLKGLKVKPDIKRGSGYDLCFWLSDGSIPTLLARRNILHFQRPFFDVEGKSLINRMKFFRINKVVVNSQFTKSWIDKEYPVKSVVLYPPVNAEKFKPKKKENLILYVGRFSQLEQAKRQDVLVAVFKNLYDKFTHDWKLILAGGSDIGRTNFIDRLKTAGKGYPIKILENPSFRVLKPIYESASLFWSGAGFEIDSEREPQKVEHFGISVVEAMAAGAVPIIFDAGGHKEIVREGENGYLWKSKEDLLVTSKELMSDKDMLRKLSLAGRKDSKKFSYERFKREFLALV